MTNNENSKQDEVRKILTFVYFEWSKEITSELVAYWRMNLTGKRISVSWLAAKLLVRTKTYGEPKLQDFIQCYQAIEHYGRAAGRVTYNPWCKPEDEDAKQDWPELHELMNNELVGGLLSRCNLKLIS